MNELLRLSSYRETERNSARTHPVWRGDDDDDEEQNPTAHSTTNTHTHKQQTTNGLPTPIHSSIHSLIHSIKQHTLTSHTVHSHSSQITRHLDITLTLASHETAATATQDVVQTAWTLKVTVGSDGRHEKHKGKTRPRHDALVGSW